MFLASLQPITNMLIIILFLFKLTKRRMLADHPKANKIHVLFLFCLLILLPIQSNTRQRVERILTSANKKIKQNNTAVRIKIKVKGSKNWRCQMLRLA